MNQRSNRFLLGLTAVLALSLMVATLAMAARIIGDEGPNVLVGTEGHDRSSPRAATTSWTPWAAPTACAPARATTP